MPEPAIEPKVRRASLLVQQKVFVVWYVLAFSLIMPAMVSAEDDAGSFLDRGISFAEKEDYSAAIAEYDNALNLDPNLAAAYFQRGYAYSGSGDIEKAIADYTQAINRDPNYANAYLYRGYAYGEKGDYDRAMADSSQAISVDPNYADAYVLHGYAYSKKGDYEWAIADYTQAIILDPNYAAAYKNRGDAYDSMGDSERAKADYAQAAMLDPNYARAEPDHARTAMLPPDDSNSPAAGVDAEAAYESPPIILARDETAGTAPQEDAGVYYDSGNAHYNKGEIDLAIADYTRAITLDPNLAYAYCNRGAAYYKKGNPDLAIADYTRALTIDSNYILAYTNRGNMYYNRGDLDKALADYVRANSIAPNDANAVQGIERVRQAQAQIQVQPEAQVNAAVGAQTYLPERILSGGSMSREKMAGFLLKNNQALGKRRDWVNNLIDIYIAEAGREGVNYEIAFAQMCYHTNYLKFEHTFAKAGTNNFCGINSLASEKKAYAFETVQIGVKAHIQHLKGYATGEPLKGICVDPRYQNIGKTHGFGSAATIDGLSGKWAGAGYAKEIRKILTAMYK